MKHIKRQRAGKPSRPSRNGSVDVWLRMRISLATENKRNETHIFTSLHFTQYTVFFAVCLRDLYAVSFELPVTGLCCFSFFLRSCFFLSQSRNGYEKSEKCLPHYKMVAWLQVCSYCFRIFEVGETVVSAYALLNGIKCFWNLVGRLVCMCVWVNCVYSHLFARYAQTLAFSSWHRYDASLSV